MDVGDTVAVGNCSREIMKLRKGDGYAAIVLDSPISCAYPTGTAVKVVHKEVFSVYVQLQPGDSRAVDMQAAARISQGVFALVEEETKDPMVVMFPAAKPPTPISEPARGERILRHMNRKHSTVDNVGHTTKVVVTITQLHGNGIDELPSVRKVLNSSCLKGEIIPALVDSIQDVTGVKSHINAFMVADHEIEQWSVEGCDAHMSHVVRKFEEAYTRREVPMAIFNECTNYMPALSFSHDMKPTHEDVRRCREATVKFVNAWNFGNYAKPGWPTTWKYQQTPAGKAMGDWPKVWWAQQLPHLMTPASSALMQENATQNPTGRAAPGWSNGAQGFYNGLAGKLRPSEDQPLDFKEFCGDVCEKKYGGDAPWCHAAENLAKGN